MTTQVNVQVSRGVAVLTLDGPETLNAFSADTGRQLSAAYAACDSDDEVRVVVLTGAGRAFCSGADLRPDAAAFVPTESFSASPVQPPAFAVRKLVIAAVNGHALGIGLTLALQCDLRYVSLEAKLGIPQVRIGMIGDAQSHWTLQRIAGTAVAADLLLTGRTFGGDEASRLGIANHALPAEEVLPAALAMAYKVAAAASPAALALSKHLLWSDLTAPEVASAETAAHQLLMGHSDAHEGPTAWRERRTPLWGFQVSDLQHPPNE